MIIFVFLETWNIPCLSCCISTSALDCDFWTAAVLSFSPWCLQGLEWGQWRPMAALCWMRDESNNLLGANFFYSSEFRSCWETNEDISGVLLIKLVWRTDLDLSPEWPFYSCPLISSLRPAWAENWVCKVGSGTVVPSHRETQEISKKMVTCNDQWISDSCMSWFGLSLLSQWREKADLSPGAFWVRQKSLFYGTAKGWRGEMALTIWAGVDRLLGWRQDLWCLEGRV